MTGAICDIHFARGRLAVLAVPPASGPGPHAEVGGLSLPLLPVAEGAAPVLAPPFRLEKQRAEGYDLRAGAEGDWMVAGVPNSQLRVHDRHSPCTLRLAPPVELPEGSGALEFRAGLASHRARGLLSLRITHADGGPDTQLTAGFDPGWAGGRSLAGYLPVRLSLPPSPVRRTVSLWLEYHRSTDPLSKFDPYMFIAWPRLVSQDGDAWPIEPVLLHQPPQPGAIWHAALIPPSALSPGTELAVVWGETRLPVFTAGRVGVRLVQDRGHELSLQAEAPLAAVAWIDEAPAFALALDAQPQRLLLPAEHLTGTPGRLQIRDPSGSQILLDTWILRRHVTTPLPVLQRGGQPPFAPRLMAASEARFRGLRAHIAAGADAATLAQLGRIIDALEGGTAHSPGLESLLPLAFPQHDAPEVSVVIPAHNHLAVTHACLMSLLLAHCRARFEVILVDDGSTDDTPRIGEIVTGLRILRHETPQRFLRACNAGAALARAPHLVLLNNDTEVTPGWLDALLDAFTRFPRVGLAGAKLLDPDGTLQEAGCIIWNNGTAWRYAKTGRHDPQVSYARQTDYVSGAAVMVSREAWEAVGGLSDAFAPMYYEDTDLAFKLRAAGYTTWYIPGAEVFHDEGTTSGTTADPTAGTGMKRYQAINQPEFRRRWGRAFAGHGPVGRHPQLEKDRGITGRVLFIDAMLPRPDRDAGGFAAVQEIRLVQSLGYKVTFLPENLVHLGDYAEALQRMGVEVITSPFALSCDAFLQARGHEFDAIYITRHHVAMAMLERIRQVNPRAPVILNNADLHFLRRLRAALADAASGDDPEEAARRMASVEAVQKAELEAIHKVDLTLSYSDVEQAVIGSFARAPLRIATCPWVVEPPATVPPRKGRKGMSFLGSFTHHPNADGLDWFARAVLPPLAEAAPDLVLSVYGSAMGPRQRALEGPTLRAVGHVPEVRDAYDPHLVFVAPLLAGAGIKGKVIGALAHGIPCILSPIAAEGTGLRHAEDCLIAETPQDWQEAILSLTQDAKLWQRLSDNGRVLVAERFSFARGRETMRAIFESLGLYASLP